MIGWNREFQYLRAKIIGKIVKYEYLPPKTIHFSLSHLTLSSLSHVFSPLFSWLWFHSQSLSVALGQPLFEFILMHLFRGLSSKLIIPPSVRASVLFEFILMHLFRGLSSKLIIPPSVRASVRQCVPLLGEAQNICFCTILSEISENHFTVLSSRRPQNTP